ncbi:MAG: 5'/3'-nucleotidase SurE [Alphaproteobacteria bacterium]|nr:5'/3'-nucleotidase SurE [Alphaproteobacteria bacterium]
MAADRKSKYRVLITNDDGIHAPGLKVMERIAKTLSSDIWVVAPEFEQSGAGHSLTLHLPLRLRKINPRRYALRGTPTDCVMMAVNYLMKEARPNLILSGVNRGANLGEDVTYSGTVSAALEGALLGIPSIALSQTFRNGNTVRWETVTRHAPALLKKVLAVGWPKDVLININFPDVPADEIKGANVTRQGKRDQTELLIDARIDARNQPYYWLGFRPREGNPRADTDLAAIARGEISVTPLEIDLTHRPTMARLAKAIE